MIYLKLTSAVALLALYTLIYAGASSISGAQNAKSAVKNQPIDKPVTSQLLRGESQKTPITKRAIMRSIFPLFGSNAIEDLLSKDNVLMENNHLSINSDSENIPPMDAVESKAQQSNTSSPFSMFAGQNNDYKDLTDLELEKAELHTNNHQSLSSIHSSNSNSQNSRHYTSYQMSLGNQLLPSVSYYGKFNSLHPGPNTYSNGLNLNYIHSLLSKPSSSSNSLSNLLNFNSNILPLTSSPFGVSLQNGYVSSYYSVPQLPAGGLNNNQQQTSSEKYQVQQKSQSSTSAQQHLYNVQEQQSNLTTNSDTLDNQLGNLPPCGKQQMGNREPRIVGGNSTYEGEYPWAVSIQRQGNHHCGGVIVGRKWILTAAHCVRSQLVGNLIVRTGGHTLTRSSNHINSHLGRDYLVEQIIMHDDFSRYDNLTASQMKSSANTNNADIALLKLKNDIQWNEFAWPVCFPSKNSGNFSGHDATVIGWGKLNEKSEDFSNELQKVKLTIIDNKVCQNWFRQAGRDMPIDERIICAGFKNGGKDACHGDSGGPLLSKINGQYVVVGVVSTGIGCARPLLPGLYSRVSSYISWIERYVTPWV